MGYSTRLAQGAVATSLFAAIAFALASHKQKGENAATAELEIEDREFHMGRWVWQSSKTSIDLISVCFLYSELSVIHASRINPSWSALIFLSLSSQVTPWIDKTFFRDFVYLFSCMTKTCETCFQVLWALYHFLASIIVTDQNWSFIILWACLFLLSSLLFWTKNEQQKKKNNWRVP